MCTRSLTNFVPIDIVQLMYYLSGVKIKYKYKFLHRIHALLEN